jgi:hypothetical protein
MGDRKGLSGMIGVALAGVASVMSRFGAAAQDVASAGSDGERRRWRGRDW